MHYMSLKSIKIEAEKAIEGAGDLKVLDAIFRKYLGRKGELALVFHSFAKLPGDQRTKQGKEANQVKRLLEEKIQEKASLLAAATEAKEEKEWIDVTIPGKKPRVGHLHPLTQVKRSIEEIFQTMGFSVVEGPEIETEYYNFDALNIPADHPARDLWDTFWLKSPAGKKLLLRTHMSPVQIRYIEKHNPPFRIIMPGRVFRHEATDASHDVQFYQVEGLMIGKDVAVSHFRAIIQEFFSRFFGKKVSIRLRPSFFPFTEPSFEVDMSCLICGGKGCSACAKTGWMEIMGAGMVHPYVLKAGGLNPKFWQGFAFGIGIDRLAMMKYRIHDIRLFYQGDMRFLQQF